MKTTYTFKLTHRIWFIYRRKKTVNGENLLEYSINEIRQLRNEEITERLNQKRNERVINMKG